MDIASAELFPRINAKAAITIAICSVAYLILSWFVVGYKIDQVVLISLVNGLYYLSGYTRRFLFAFLIMAVYWVIFDYMKALPNYRVSTVHIKDLYDTEKSLFGIHSNGTILTPNEYLKANSRPWLDAVTGMFYLCWIPVPMAFGAYLVFTRPGQGLRFLLTFFLVNLLGFVVYYTYPAAPPWFIQEHGFNFIPLTKASTAGLDRFDQYFHVHIFRNIYEKGSNVFAAMPSLHSSYPMIVLFYGLKNKLGWINIVLATVMVGIWFTAVYASHHYVVDVLAGICCATLGISLFHLLEARSAGFRRFLNSYTRLVTKGAES